MSLEGETRDSSDDALENGYEYRRMNHTVGIVIPAYNPNPQT
jgi:hypothetical protein